MIKKYHNALLAAAVAAFVIGCGGGDGGSGPADPNPLSDPNVGTNLGEKDGPTLRAIADLIGGIMGDIAGNSEMIFETFDVVSSDATALGKILSAGNADSAVSTPTGINTLVGAKCTGGVNGDPNDETTEFFELAVLIELENATQDLELPDFNNGLKDLALGDLKTALDLRFRNCNEPKHTYNNDPNDDIIADPVISPRILDGKFSIVLNSENEIPGSNSDKDFQLEGKITMDQYFIQTDLAVKPDLVSGDITLTLVTNDVDANNYETVLDFSLTTNDGEKDEYIRTNLTAEGSIGLTNEFGIDSYSLDLGGDLRKGTSSSNQSYRVFTVSTITSNDGLNPSAGKFGIIDLSNDFTHYATAENGGLTFDLQENAAGDRKTPQPFCTWTQIENDTCDVN